MFAPSVGPALRRYGCVCRVVINEDDADDGVDVLAALSLTTL